MASLWRVFLAATNFNMRPYHPMRRARARQASLAPWNRSTGFGSSRAFLKRFHRRRGWFRAPGTRARGAAPAAAARRRQSSIPPRRPARPWRRACCIDGLSPRPRCRNTAPSGMGWQNRARGYGATIMGQGDAHYRTYNWLSKTRVGGFLICPSAWL